MDNVVPVGDVLDEDPDETLGAFWSGVDADEVDGFGGGGHGDDCVACLDGPLRERCADVQVRFEVGWDGWHRNLHVGPALAELDGASRAPLCVPRNIVATHRKEADRGVDRFRMDSSGSR